MPESFGGRRVMVVEDEGLILLTLRDMLEDLGCEIAAAESRAGPAIEAVDGTAVDAALLDVNLGGGETSYPVADALAARGIPFAFLTGYGSGALRDEYKERPVLSKPVDERNLEAVLRQLFAAGAAPAA